MAVGDDILRQMAAIGAGQLGDYDVFDEQKARAELAKLDQQAALQERNAMAREAAIVKAAVTPAFLAWLRSKTIELPASAAMLAAKTAEELAILSARKQGADQVYFTILEAMAFETDEPRSAGGAGALGDQEI